MFSQDRHEPPLQTNIVDSFSRYLLMKHTTVPDRRWKQDPFDWHVSIHTYTVNAPIPTPLHPSNGENGWRICLG